MPTRRATTESEPSPATAPEGVTTLSSLKGDEAERGTGMAVRTLEKADPPTEGVTLTSPAGTRVTVARDAVDGLKAAGFK